MRTATDREKRFWKNVDKHGPVPAHRPELGPCWLWTGSKRNGYGAFDNDRAHRVSYALKFGPPKKNVLHHCDTPACVNPGHLFEGTQADNLEDMRAKGRRKGWGKTKKASGPTQSYAERVAAGRAPVFVWLSPEAVAALEVLTTRGMSKTEAINAGLVGLAYDAGHRNRTPEPRRAKAPPPAEVDPEEAEELAEQERRPRDRGAILSRPGSPADLAERVRAGGTRRKATEL